MLAKKIQEGANKAKAAAAAASRSAAVTIATSAREARTTAVKRVEMVKDSAKKALSEDNVRRLPEVVERLQSGHAVFSQSFRSDLWLFLKNNHLIFSLFLAHPKHPFSPCERRVCLTCSLALGLGLTCLFNLMRGDDDGEGVSDAAVAAVTIVIGGALQGIYDTLLKLFATCSCVQSCPTPVRSLFECCGAIGLAFQFIIGAVFCVSGVLLLRAIHGGEELGVAAWQFFASKSQAWFVSSVLVASLSFWLRRRKQMRPDSPEAYEKWNAVPDGKKKMSLCGVGAAKPQSFLWNQYVGEDATFADLPVRAPRYSYTICGQSFGQDEEEEGERETDAGGDVESGVAPGGRFDDEPRTLGNDDA